MTQTFTAPKAYIMIENKPAGFVRQLTFTENIQRQGIKGLGNLYDVEVPAVSASNTFNVDMFFIDFQQPVVKSMINRLGGVEALKNTLSLGDLPFSINIYKKTIKSQDANSKLVTEVDKTGKEIAVLRDCYIDSQNFQIAESGIASLGTTGRYLSPVCQNEL